MREVLGHSQAEVIRERDTMVLTFRGDHVAPLIGAVYSCSAIRIGVLVSGKLICFRVQPLIAIYPREGAHEVTTRGRHFGLRVFLAV